MRIAWAEHAVALTGFTLCCRSSFKSFWVAHRGSSKLLGSPSLLHNRSTPHTNVFGGPYRRSVRGRSLLPAVSLSDAELPVTRKEAFVWFFATAVSVYGSVSSKPVEAESLGVVDDLLSDCPQVPSCVSTQDDRPYCFMEPWSYETTTEVAMNRVRNYIELDDGAKIVTASPRYLRAEYEVRASLPPTVDEVEFYFTPGDDVVQFRAGRREGPTDFGGNRRRMERMRIALQFEQVPVLRNRRRAFVFGESPLDSFGPSLNPGLDQSMIYGDVDPMSPAFEVPSKALLERDLDQNKNRRPSWWGEQISRAGGYYEWRPPGGGVGTGGRQGIHFTV